MALARELSHGGNQQPPNGNGNRAVPLRPGSADLPQYQETEPAQQTIFQGDNREPFQFATPQQQQSDMSCHDQIAPMLHQLSGLGATDLQMANGMQHCGYEYDCDDLGSGAETPELDNEHPLSRQASAQAPPDALMQILANMQQHPESQQRGDVQPSRPSPVTQGPPARTSMQHGYFEHGSGGDVPRASYAGGGVADFPFVVPARSRRWCLALPHKDTRDWWL